jgi:hypothetical protein
MKNKDLCPRCKKRGFSHGFFPNDEYYCSHCHLWNPHPSSEQKASSGIPYRHGSLPKEVNS